MCLNYILTLNYCPVHYNDILIFIITVIVNILLNLHPQWYQTMAECQVLTFIIVKGFVTEKYLEIVSIHPNYGIEHHKSPTTVNQNMGVVDGGTKSSWKFVSNIELHTESGQGPIYVLSRANCSLWLLRSKFLLISLKDMSLMAGRNTQQLRLRLHLAKEMLQHFLKRQGSRKIPRYEYGYTVAFKVEPLYDHFHKTCL